MHKAIVSVANETYHIQVLDRLIKTVFGDEYLKFQGDNGYQTLNQYKDPLAKNVLDRIITAVEKEVYPSSNCGILA
ncbi:MAG: hypothetical protein C4329_08925 [Chitinophagaceae bacterium]